MWSCEHTIDTADPPAELWARLSEVESWPSWDEGLDWVRLDGPFAVGTTGKLKPSGGPTTRFRLLEVQPERSFVDETRLPLARMRFSHRLEPLAGGTRLTHRVEITGPLAPLFARVIGRGIAADLPQTMQRLAA